MFKNTQIKQKKSRKMYLGIGLLAVVVAVAVVGVLYQQGAIFQGSLIKGEVSPNMVPDSEFAGLTYLPGPAGKEMKVTVDSNGQVKTIQEALKIAAPGAVITFKPGSYVGFALKDAKVTLIADSDKVSFTSPVTLKNFTGTFKGFEFIDFDAKDKWAVYCSGECTLDAITITGVKQPVKTNAYVGLVTLEGKNASLVNSKIANSDAKFLVMSYDANIISNSLIKNNATTAINVRLSKDKVASVVVNNYVANHSGGRDYNLLDVSKKVLAYDFANASRANDSLYQSKTNKKVRESKDGKDLTFKIDMEKFMKELVGKLGQDRVTKITGFLSVDRFGAVRPQGNGYDAGDVESTGLMMN